MKTLSSLLLLASATSMVSASGREAMERLMNMKLRDQEMMESQGFFRPERYRASSAVTKCVNGKAGEYTCDNVDLHGFIPHAQLGSSTRRGNDVWGRLCSQYI